MTARAMLKRFYAAAGLCVALPSLANCTDSTTPTQLTVYLRSDLTPGSQLSYVRADLLDPTSDQAVSSRWLKVSKDCTGKGVSPRILGSFGVKKRDRAVARLRITGFHESAAGHVEPLVEQRVDVTYQEHRNFPVDVVLSQACVETTDCVAGSTCEPASGNCVAVPTVQRAAKEPRDAMEAACLREAIEPPVVDPTILDAGADGSIENVEDASNGSETDGGQNAVRPDSAAPGAACHAQSDCGDLYCADGVCCDAPCDGACDACNLKDHVGICSPMDLSADPQNCGKCGMICDYGYCASGACQSSFVGAPNASSVYQMDSSRLWFFPLIGVPPAKLVAIGVLTLVSPTAKVRLALFKMDNGSVGPLVFEAPAPVAVVDSDFTDLTHPKGSEVRLQQPVDIVEQGDYWVMVLFSANAQVYSSEGTSDAYYSTDSVAFDASLAPLPPLMGVDGSASPVNVYAVITPQ